MNEAGPSKSNAFTSAEISAMRDRTPFETRTRVMSSLEVGFRSLKRRLAEQFTHSAYLAPAGVDWVHGKIGQGEHLDGVPYMFLDYPRYFTDESSFTFRSLFWWGQGLTFSLILGGSNLDTYRRNLLENLPILGALDVQVAVGENPWDWHQGEGHTLSLAQADASVVGRLLRQQDFLKCSRVLGFDDVEFRQNRIDEAGLYAFRSLEPLVLI